MSIYTRMVRPWLFRLNAETAHRLSVQACGWVAGVPGAKSIAQAWWGTNHAELSSQVAGLHFPNPVGLAAGWDKSGHGLGMLGHLGFGSVEIGSVSARASNGNPRPRLFRLPEDRSIVVNYGLPNDGADVVARRLAKHHLQIPLGVNIVTTNHGIGTAACSADEIFADYARSAELLHQHASYLTLNLSCPNAPDGKDFFATAGNLKQLLLRLADLPLRCPVFLKLAPSAQAADQDRWLTEVEQFDFVRGFMFNLAPGKPAWLKMRSLPATWQHLPGAVAGRAVSDHMNRCIASLYARMDRRRYAIIGGGGVFTADDAWEKICLGASLVQIYTALVYEGPGVIRQINDGLLQHLRQAGCSNIQQAVGLTQRAA